MSWLPPPRRRAPRKLRPWRAPSLSGTGVELSRLTYIVVEEIVGGAVGLSLSPWPSADSRGRLRFDVDDDPVHVATEADTLVAFLRKRHVRERSSRESGGWRDRQLLIGTTFASEVRFDESARWTKPLDRWIPGPIYDITADAREVAKLAYYAATTDRWSEHRAEALRLTESTRGAGPHGRSGTPSR